MKVNSDIRTSNVTGVETMGKLLEVKTKTRNLMIAIMLVFADFLTAKLATG